ncbi:MAG: histidine phosphotransferase family protein [Rhodospirillales bacterium]|nr:histidine phosphotransferase family protein [Rhodospirillales bacterium]
MADSYDWRVAELLCSKLCHDLISPVGAINNGLELLGEDRSMWDEAVALIGQSGRQAAARLSFFRVAFGGAGHGETMTAEDAAGLAEDFFAGSKITLTWASPVPMPANVMPRYRAKLLLNLVLLAAETLPRGGEVHASPEEAANSISVWSSGEGCRLTDAAAACLTGQTPAEALEARDVVPYLCRALAESEGLTVTHAVSGSDTVEFRAF